MLKGCLSFFTPEKILHKRGEILFLKTVVVPPFFVVECCFIFLRLLVTFPEKFICEMFY
jgi:hypothetical protein